MLNEPGWQLFVHVCAKYSHTKDLDALFEVLFTPDEKEQMALRLLIIQALLRQAKPQRQLAQELGISIAKITRGSNALKMMDSHTKTMLKKFFKINSKD
ncbi:MAG TPA: trp operon repressor [Coxiellaceae bacterium]|nr:trp operon repressor [Coxiellaceae bacterium]